MEAEAPKSSLEAEDFDDRELSTAAADGDDEGVHDGPQRQEREQSGQENPRLVRKHRVGTRHMIRVPNDRFAGTSGNMAREEKPANSDSESTEEARELDRLGLGPPDATDDAITHREEEELELMEQHESKLGERLSGDRRPNS